MKRNQFFRFMIAVILCISVLCTLGISAFAETPVNEVTEQTVGDTTQNMTADAAAEMSEEMSAFEITAKQRQMAKENTAGLSVLDAGRGNPNWINTKARLAFARFMEFAVAESELDFSDGDMAGHASQNGIGTRFEEAMDPNNEADAFLIDAVEYCVEGLGLDKDELIKEWVDGIIGDYYPTPSRCLNNTEKILNAYLQSVLYNGVDLADSTQVFPTEGGSAAMCYIFDSLSHNKLLNPGDKIAIATPIFTPYLEIPDVKNYGLVSIDVSSSEEDSWDISSEELDKLKDPEIKAFFLVNPSNPASHALSENTLQKLQEVVAENPNLIILTDDVYGTFVDNFQTVYSVLPQNTILVYSYSKLYGATGWRIGMIAMNEDNVCDKLLAQLSDEDKAFLEKEYSSVTTDVAAMPFIKRVTADSRSIGLYHTSGLSTPSQIFMDFLSLTHLVDEEYDPYIALSKEKVHERYAALMEALNLEADSSPENAQYYTLVNINALCEELYGEDFTEWKIENISDLDFLNDLASREGVVLMYGPGFETEEGYVRVSLANLNTEDYVEIANRLLSLLDEYNLQYEAETGEGQMAIAA